MGHRSDSNAVFDRGGSTTNRIEAAAVAEAVMQHARRSPDKSLGVGAFSVAQRDAILDELERLRRQDTSCETFFAPGNPDPFFVKNLENIQGDERDVIFISVGYGRDADGYLAMSFGPLQTDGGERRLNVLISRSRDRCEVFSSITADDIDLTRARSRGAQAFKTFLAFAKTGILDVASATNGDHDSEFESEVARALAGHGFQVHAQVGIAGFFVDLAIVDPEVPGRYLIGIECDGRSYHSSRSARDRDRLRENVLRSRGWNIHRIWSTDWFHRPDEQIRKTLAAIDRAKAEWAARKSSEALRQNFVQPTTQPQSIERAKVEPQSNGNGNSISVPYEEAASIGTAGTVVDMPIPQLVKLIEHILSVEGPIHTEELTRRAVELTGGKRTTKRSLDAVSSAIAAARRKQLVTEDGNFVTLAGQANFPVRNRAQVASQSLRKPEMIAPAEIRAAIACIVNAHCGATIEEVVTAASRALGFAATSAQLRATIESQITAAQNVDGIVCRDGKLFPTEA